MKILSIIIPTFNVEKYLDQCLTSLSNLKKYQDVEVLIINDGSTDNSAEIAERYIQESPGLFKLFNKSNGGYGSVLNFGIRNAEGKYIRVLDSDDWFNQNVIDDYINAVRNTTADILATEFTMLNMTTGKNRHISFPTTICENQVYNFEDICNYAFIAMHMLTIRKELYTENRIFIDENTFYTDLEFVVFPLEFIKTIEYKRIDLYQYRIGIPGQSVSHEGWFKHRKDHEKVTEKLIECLKNQDKDNPKYEYVKLKVYELITVHFRNYTQFSPSKKGLYNELQIFDEKISMVKKDWRGNSKDFWINILIDSNYKSLKFQQIVYFLKKKILK